MAHKQEMELNTFLKFAGYAQSVDEFEASTGLNLTYPTRPQSYYNQLGIQNADPFYSSYSSLSKVTIKPKDSLTTGFTDETIKQFKSRVRAKISQRRKLEHIRSYALVVIPKFIEKSFGIEQHLISNQEIVFGNFCKFKVGGAEFSYYGTISAQNFNIYTTAHESYEQVYEKVKLIHHHFTSRQTGLLKPIDV